VAAYVYAVKKAIGALAAALGGVETLVFSGGIGEHASAIRARVCDGMDLVGLRLDPDLNARHAPLISSSASPVIVRVIPTDEELMIAQATCAMLA
jgi:acetate kinase